MFFKRELFIGNLLYLPDFKTDKISPCCFSKALGATPRHLYPIGAKDLSSPVLKSFQQIQRLVARNG
jgi:hypothetical protein